MSKFIVEFDLSQRELAQICQNSIERLLNTAIEVGEHVQTVERTETHMGEKGSTLWQDCEELKPLTVKLWDAVRNQIFKEKLR